MKRNFSKESQWLRVRLLLCASVIRKPLGGGGILGNSYEIYIHIYIDTCRLTVSYIELHDVVLLQKIVENC